MVDTWMHASHMCVQWQPWLIPAMSWRHLNCCDVMHFNTQINSFVHKVLLSAIIRSGAGLQASAGAPEGRGLRRGPVELWKLHLPQSPCTQPLWTVRDAALHLSSVLHCVAQPCPVPLDSISPIPQKICRICLEVFPCQSIYKSLLPAEEEPLSLSAHSSCSHLLLLCTLTLVSHWRMMILCSDSWRLFSCQNV